MYELIIIGCGPAGLTASIYASCYKLSHLVIGKVTGGQLNLAPDILNYPGFSQVKGSELASRMLNQTQQYGTKVITEEVVGITKDEDKFTIITDSQKQYESKTVILATGTERRKLNVSGERKYSGAGVFYSIVMDSSLYRDKQIIIVGGGNAGFQAASKVVNDASSITILEVTDTTRAEKVWIDQINNNPKLKILFNTKVKEIKGNGNWITEVIVDEKGQQKSLPADLMVVEIGGVPGTALLSSLGIELTEKGFIKVDDTMKTSIPAVFAAGDIVGSGLSLEQLSTAIGLGARAAASAYFYLKQQSAPIVWGKAEIRRV